MTPFNSKFNFLKNYKQIIFLVLKLKTKNIYKFINKQLVMASDGETSYVLFNYGRIDWPNRIVNVNVTVGFNLGDNHTYFQIEPLVSHFNLTDLQHGSNVGMRSRLIYSLSIK